MIDYKKIVLTLAVVLFVSGCSITAKKKGIEVTSVPATKTPLNIKDPSPLELRDFEWIIITEENADEIWEFLKEENEGVALFALRHKDYQNLSLNVKDIRSHLGEYIYILKKYKEYYEGENKDE